MEILAVSLLSLFLRVRVLEILLMFFVIKLVFDELVWKVIN